MNDKGYPPDYCTEGPECNCPRCRPYQQDEYEAAMAQNIVEEEYDFEPAMASEEYPSIDDEEPHVNPYHHMLQEIVSKANKNHEYWELGGDFDYHDPYQDLQDALVGALEEVIYLKRHRHEYGSDEYCWICGKDGRA
jgi:hypothetical protein